MTITLKLTTLTVLFLFAGLLLAQAPSGDGHKATPQVCHLISANPPEFNPFQFVPKVADFKRLNRFPKVAYVVNEDGSVSNVKILKGTGSPKVDAGLVKSVLAWKYKPQPGCTFEMSMGVIIDIGPR
jgi:TonB family protein